MVDHVFVLLFLFKGIKLAQYSGSNRMKDSRITISAGEMNTVGSNKELSRITRGPGAAAAVRETIPHCKLATWLCCQDRIHHNAVLFPLINCYWLHSKLKKTLMFYKPRACVLGCRRRTATSCFFITPRAMLQL